MINDYLKRKRQKIVFYSEALNIETVLNWIRDLPQQDRSALGLDLDLVQAGWQVDTKGGSDGSPCEKVGRVTAGLFGGVRRPKRGDPLCRKLASGIWELQSALPSGKLVSLLFFVRYGRVHVLHGYFKKSDDVPRELMVLARQRMVLMLDETA
jgi:phage-related protein